MQVVINNRKDFLKVLTLCSKIVPSKTVIPITACLKVDVNEGQMTVTSTNEESTIIHKFIGESSDIFSFCIDAKDFKNAISLLVEESFAIIVEDKGESIVIKYNKGKMRLPIFSSNEFKEQDEVSYYANINIDPHSLFDAISEGNPFCDIDGLRPIISGLYLYFKNNKMGFASTNMFSIYWKEQQTNKDIQAYCLFPKNTLGIIQDIINGSFDCDIYFSERNISIRCTSCIINIRLAEGNFPDVERVCNINHNYECKVSKNELIEAVRRSSFASDKLSQLVALNIREGEMDIQGEDVLMAKKVRDSIQCQANGTILVGLKYEKLLSVLDNIKTDNVIIHFTNETTPITFNDDGDSDTVMLLVTYQINNF